VSADEIVRQTWQRLEHEVAEQGYELVEVEFGQHGSRWVLRIYIDKEGGVTIDDCAAVSQFLSPLLDKLDFIEGSYVLEVSSPGIDRPLRKPEDFQRFVEEKVRVLTRTPVEGRKRFSGRLASLEDGLLTIDCGGKAYRIHIENVQKARLDR